MALYTKDARNLFHSKLRQYVVKNVEKLSEKIRSSEGECEDKLFKEEMLNDFMEMERLLWLVEGLSRKETDSIFWDPEYTFIQKTPKTETLCQEIMRKRCHEYD